MMKKLIEMNLPKYQITALDDRLSIFAKALSLTIRALISRILILEGDFVDRDLFTQLTIS
jgi:hypothetical protein